jgi:hypothetical protein
MRTPKKKPTAEKLRAWRASLMRSRSQLLGIVYAPGEKFHREPFFVAELGST